MIKLIFSFFIISFSVMAQQSNFEIQGHRGSRGLMPENTIPAFLKAIDEGVETLEMDVIISKDKKVIVSHDPFFDPTISTFPSGEMVTETTKGNTFLLNYKEIKKVDVGLRGNPRFPEQEKRKAYKPLLKDVIKQAEQYAKKKGLKPLKYNIELKSLKSEYSISQPEVAEFSELVYHVISKYLPKERICIQSFDYNILKYWHKNIENGHFQKVELSALIEPEENNEIEYNLKLLGFIPDVWSPYFRVIDKEMVNNLIAKGIKVIPWTVNEISDMQNMYDLGCNGLITDYPNRAKSLKF